MTWPADLELGEKAEMLMSEAFVKQEMRARFEADQKLVQETDWRERVAKIISDAMEATGGN